MKCTCGKPVRFDGAIACHGCWKRIPEELKRYFYRRVRGDIGDARTAVRHVREYLRVTSQIDFLEKSIIGVRNKFRKGDTRREVAQLEARRKTILSTLNSQPTPAAALTK
jgi:hypothetical protein